MWCADQRLLKVWCADQRLLKLCCVSIAGSGGAVHGIKSIGQSVYCLNLHMY